MKVDSGPKAKTSITTGLFVLALFGSTAYAADLTVQVAKVSADSGNIRVAIHDGEEGLPSKREPLGFSRDARGRIGPPSFDSATISIAENDMEITISLSD